MNSKPWLEKTKLCRNERNGRCSFGDRCWFAHSEAETRCYEFIRHGTCPLGLRCTKHHPTTSQIAAFELARLAERSEFKGRRPDKVNLPYTRDFPSFFVYATQCGMAPLMDRVATSKEDTERKRMFLGLDLLQGYYSVIPTFSGRRLTADQAMETDQEARLLLQRLLATEWCQALSDLRAYDLEDIYITPVRDLWRIDCQGLAEKRPSVLRGDLISVRRMKSIDSTEWHFGYVHFVNLDHVVVHFHQRSLIDTSEPYHVVFNMSDTNTRRQFLALNTAPLFTKQCFHERVLSPEELKSHSAWSLSTWDTQRQEKFTSTLNPEQKLAVNRICNGGSVPPEGNLGLLLLHGPPGTGKTTTVVGAIAALAVHQRRVLVVTPSNQSANLIVERLHIKLGRNHRERVPMLRVVAQSYDWRKECSAEVQPYVMPNENFSVQAIDDAVVVVSTVSTAGTLWAVSAAPFHHIIIDEAGQATEAEVAVPLAFAGNGGVMVTLAGDHKQLGPILRSKAAASYDFHRSMLERLMSSRRTRETFSMQLTKSYRAHPDILHTYNTLTYNNTLEAHADPKHTHRVLQINSGIHSNMRHPLRFYHVKGEESRESDSPSWMNEAEVRVVIQLITDLLDQGFSFEDIVVLSPYAKQCKRISGILHKKFSDGERLFRVEGYDGRRPPIKVCSVELFQGREAPIIILSCVRSRQPSLVQADQQMGIGFLKQPQRLNVAISRAIAGLFIVGNAGTLQQDHLWRSLIDILHKKFASVHDASGDRGAGAGTRVLTDSDVENLRMDFGRDPGAGNGALTDLPPDSMRLDTEWGRQQ